LYSIFTFVWFYSFRRGVSLGKVFFPFLILFPASPNTLYDNFQRERDGERDWEVIEPSAEKADLYLRKAC
jgi:hypothetical protein